MTILQKLSQWQKSQAAKEGLEGYMVVSFSTLKLIAATTPQTIEELLTIKGMGPKKVEKYGKDLLEICGGAMPAVREHTNLFDEAHTINEHTQTREEDTIDIAFGVVDDGQESTVQSPQNIDTDTGEIVSCEDMESIGVGDFLKQLNQVIISYFPVVRLRGEIIGFKRNQNGHAYFEVKDPQGIMRCSVFKQYYDASGVELCDGMEIIITGKPTHHATYGFSFIGSFVELAGEGALKKAYEALKRKMFDEGLMDVSRKRSLPDMPKRIGLITSPTGAALGDFTTNVGNYGYTIIFHGARVEGAQAVADLLQAIDRLSTMELDVLIVTRGGGSLESLQAFNNENVVRAIAAFPVPVIAGIGHEQDETISTLVADVGVSTPTAAARAVRESYENIGARLDRVERIIIGSFTQSLYAQVQRRENAQHGLERSIATFIQKPREIILSFERCMERFSGNLSQIEQQFMMYDKLLSQYDPRKKLAQGYSIVRNHAGSIVRSIDETTVGQDVTIQVEDGSIDAQVNQINT